MDDDSWFGVVRWCNADIAAKLEEIGIEPTECNIDAVRCECKNSHHFTDGMIEAGWLAIESIIDDVFSHKTDDFDYEAAGLFNPSDCDPENPPRLCYGCKFEEECCYGYKNKTEV